MIKILTILVAIAFLLQIPVFVSAEVYIPDHEYVGFYDHDGVYTVIGGIKNTEIYPVTPTITVTVNDGNNIFSNDYVFSSVMPQQMLPMKIKLPQITSDNPKLEPYEITYDLTGHEFKGGYVLYNDSLVLHSDGSMTGQIKNSSDETFHDFRIYALIKDENEMILDVATSQKFDVMYPDQILDFEMIPNPKIADRIHIYSCFAFGEDEIFPLNAERNNEKFTFRYNSGAWFTNGEFNPEGTELNMYGLNSWHLDMNASLEFPQNSIHEDLEVYLDGKKYAEGQPVNEKIEKLQSLDEMGNWHLYFTVPNFYQGDVTIKGFMYPDGTVSVPEELDLSSMVMTQLTSGEVTEIIANTNENSIIFSLETDQDGILSITTSDFLIRPFSDGSFFVLVNGEQVENVKFENKILSIPYTSEADKIEVYGSYVVPEFGTIAVFILAASVVSIIILSKKHIMPHSLSKL
jgi:predicted secreted protein with PEFG-CTERM motif